MVADVLEDWGKVRSTAALKYVLCEVGHWFIAGCGPDLLNPLVALYDGQVEFSEGLEQSGKFGNELWQCFHRASRRIQRHDSAEAFRLTSR